MLVDVTVKPGRKIRLMLLLLIFMITPLFSSQVTGQPLYYIDKDIREFNNVIYQDSLIYALGGDWQNLYFYCFDQKLNLRLKTRISDSNSHTKISPFQQGFLIKNVNHEESKLMFIDTSGNFINKKLFKGYINDYFIDNKRIVLLIHRDDGVFIINLDNKFNLVSEQELTYYREIEINKLNLFHAGKNNFVINTGLKISVCQFDKKWNFIKKMNITDNSPTFVYRIYGKDDMFILDPQNANQLFYKDNLPEDIDPDTPDQVSFYDQKANLINTLHIPRKYKFSSYYLADDNLFVQQSLNKDTLLVIDPQGEVQRSIDLDFSLWINDRIILPDNNLLSAGRYAQCLMWSSRGSAVLILTQGSQASLQFYPLKQDAQYLDIAYTNQDQESLAELINKWYEHNPQSKTEYEHEWEREANQLYEKIYPGMYQPFKRNNVYAGTREPIYNPEYHLLPNIIAVEITDSILVSTDEKKNKQLDGSFYLPVKHSYELQDFCPDVSLDIKTINSTPNISQSLFGFLALPHKENSRISDRTKFLKDNLQIFHHHWGGAPYIFSMPLITRIVFDKDYQKAIINTRYEYLFGSYLCQKEAGVWKIVYGLGGGME